jgi:hypothetical protein
MQKSLPKNFTAMKTITKYISLSGIVAVIIFAVGCSKNNSAGSSSNVPGGQSKVSVNLMDGPIPFDKVLIDIRQIAIEVDTATSQSSQDNNNQWDNNYCGWGRGQNNKSLIWDTLTITPGLYDLLQLRNGVDTLLGSGVYVSGKILKVRITLGSDNSIYTDSTTSYPLEIFGPFPFFDINVSRQNVASVTNNQFELWLDFNIARSVFFWNGTFLLKPYIVAFNNYVSAKINGRVLPSGSTALITVYNAADTLYAIPNWGGNYLLSAVPVGTYSINFKGRNGYQDTTINNIVVDSSKVTQVPTITLHQ